MTKAGEQDSLLAKAIHMVAVLRVDEFSRCLARAWVTTLAQQVRPSVCVTAEAPVMGGINTRAGSLQRRQQERRSFCLILFFPFLF